MSFRTIRDVHLNMGSVIFCGRQNLHLRRILLQPQLFRNIRFYFTKKLGKAIEITHVLQNDLAEGRATLPRFISYHITFITTPGFKNACGYYFHICDKCLYNSKCMYYLPYIICTRKRGMEDIYCYKLVKFFNERFHRA